MKCGQVQGCILDDVTAAGCLACGVGPAPADRIVKISMERVQGTRYLAVAARVQVTQELASWKFWMLLQEHFYLFFHVFITVSSALLLQV
jgi:hypothetical protein